VSISLRNEEAYEVTQDSYGIGGAKASRLKVQYNNYLIILIFSIGRP